MTQQNDEDSNSIKKLSVLIDKEIHKEIKKRALLEDLTLSELITKLIQEYLQR